MGGRRKYIECTTFEFFGNLLLVFELLERFVVVNIANRQNLIERKMLPIVYCWALVFYQCQALTLHYASIDVSKRHFAKAKTYVVLIRLKKNDGLRILALKEKNVLT